MNNNNHNHCNIKKLNNNDKSCSFSIENSISNFFPTKISQPQYNIFKLNEKSFNLKNSNFISTYDFNTCHNYYYNNYNNNEERYKKYIELRKQKFNAFFEYKVNNSDYLKKYIKIKEIIRKKKLYSRIYEFRLNLINLKNKY